MQQQHNGASKDAHHNPTMLNVTMLNAAAKAFLEV